VAAPKLIASDLDGTLFGPDKVPESRTVEAINAVVESGMIFAAVTGRSYFGGAKRVTSTGASVHWFIGSNGGHRLNMASNEIEERLTFDEADLTAMLRDFPAQIEGIGFGIEHAQGFTYDAGFHAVLPEAFDGGPRKDSATFAADDVGKIFATHAEFSTDELIELTTPLVPPGTHVSTSGGRFIEFTPAGADKGLALARLCDQLRIASDEVVAFGDNNNDVSMLRWAGRGIAMGNATGEVLGIADEVTGTNLDFGVAQVLESLL